MEDDKKAREANGIPALGEAIKSLILPKTHDEGYPPDYICALLKSYLPNLERLHVPRISRYRDEYGDEYDDPSLKDSLKEAVAQGCPKLQHLRCSWYEGDKMIPDVVNGIVEGCQEWGLKSFYCEDLDDHHDYILETLLENHRETLEEVELANYRSFYDDKHVELLSCRNLKKVNIHRSSTSYVAIELQEVKFGCRDLRELQLTLAMPYFDKEECGSGSDEDGDEDGDEDEDEDECFFRRLARFRVCVDGWSKEAYTQIGSLSKLETLSLNYEECQRPLSFEYDLTLKHGWLRQLAGLKELKHFHMAADFWSNMGQAEVKFMDAQWPKLKKIEFSCRDLNTIIKKPNWRWLQKRRPYLRYLQYRDPTHGP